MTEDEKTGVFDALDESGDDHRQEGEENLGRTGVTDVHPYGGSGADPVASAPVAPTPSVGAASPGFSISAKVARKVTFATEQAGIPILRDLVIVNHVSQEDQDLDHDIEAAPDASEPGEDDHQNPHGAQPVDLENIDIEISAEPPFLEARTWRIDRIAAGTDLAIRDRNLKLDGGFLFGLTEAMNATVTIRAVRVREGSDRRVIWQERYPVRILAKNEWGGAGTMPELLASFVQPGDPGSERLQKAAAEALRASTSGSDPVILNGYTSGKRQAVWSMVNALWVAVGQLGLDYATPPASFETEGQKIRKPADVLESGLATCLDSVVLFASALEQMGLHPLPILVEGHAFVGVWLMPQKFATVVGEDVVDLRKRVDLDDVLVFETTLAVQHPPAPFSRAIEHAKKALRALDEADPYFRVIDVARARAYGYTPLPSFEQRIAKESGIPENRVSVTVAVEPPPPLPDFDRNEGSTAAETPDSRVERWKRRLLDLTLRNRMLNWSPGKGSLSILCHNVGELEDHLADGRIFTIKELPDLGVGTREGEEGRRDEEIVRRRLGEPVVDAAVEEGVASSLLYTDNDKKDTEARLVELFRKTRNDMQEGGANTLYLAAGMLRWKKSETDSRSYRAPLVLIPVSIERKSVKSPIRIRQHDDEPRFNSTLLQMLEADFDIRVPELGGELPVDDSGIDLPKVFTVMREAVKEVPGFEVEADRLVLSTFSFAKYLMWKDLQDRQEELKQSGLVRHLIDTPRESYADGVDFSEFQDLDARYAPKDFYLVKPADSSQLRAVAAGSEGKDFVLIGPPGTGKSQTITNLIAQFLGEEKRVLFFAEKTAALEVVYRRLQEEGLGDFCLEVHSNKARKVDVLNQLERAWDASGDLSEEEWLKEAERLGELRAELNGFVAALHRTHRNGWSAFRALSIVVAGDGLDAPKLSWPSIDMHDAASYEAIERTADDLQISGRDVADLTGTVFEAIARSDWSPSFQQDVIERAQKVVVAIDRSLEAERRFLEATGLTEALGGRPRRRDYWDRGLTALAAALVEVRGTPCDLVFSSRLNELSAELETVMATLKRYADRRSVLTTTYKEGAEARLPVEGLLTRAKEAEAAWWPKSALAFSPVRRALRDETGNGKIGKGAILADLPVLKEMKDLRRTIEKDHEPMLRGLGRISKGVETDPEQLGRSVRKIVALRDAASSLAGSVDRLSRVQSVLTPLLTTAQDMIAETGPVGSAAADLCDAHSVLVTALDEFEGIAAGRMDRDETPGPGSASSGNDGGWLETLRSDAERIVSNAAKINRWCNWRRDRIAGEAVGLGPVLEGVERGDVPVERIVDTVRLGYARWWLSGLVDQDEVLKSFAASRHEHTIERFRELDDTFNDITRRYLRAKIASKTPKKGSAERGSEFGILQRELSKKRNHMPLRQLIAKMPTALLDLTPCLLMSPLSVAQYLAASDNVFDVAIVDEGSQVTVWDAIGPLARAKQAIIVGDPKQLPPTSFFQRGDDEDGASDEEIDEDLESILDEAKAANVPPLDLTWHYRSRSESLIAFSNGAYYENRLVTFPSPRTEDKAVHLRRVEEGVYQRGKGSSRINPAEAEALVAEMTARMLAQAHLSPAAQDSLGVVTFNSDQQRLIEDLLDREIAKYPEVEQFFGERTEPVMVKNLESVQGDERDVMFFSITYGPDHTGRVRMNFGPLNRQGGERRLNVAITRARKELLVFSSIGPEDFDLNRTAAIGVHDLKDFLDYAERGPKALIEANTGSMGGHESPFEAAVAEALTSRGWRVIPQIGVGAFRIDLGVVHPDEPGRFLAGIEADGATYHSAKTARDRDKLRESVLRSLGWEILRIWSTDWWIDRRDALERIDTRLKNVLEADRKRVTEKRERAAEEEKRRAEILESLRAGAGRDVSQKDDEDDGESANARFADAASADQSAVPPRPGVGAPAKSSGDGRYRRIVDIAARFGLTDEEVKAFRTDMLRPRVREIVAGVVDAEGPVERLDVISRVGKAFGFARAGRNVREFIESCMPERPVSREQGEKGEMEFLWPAGSEPGVIDFRPPATDEDRRLVRDIALEELTGLAQSLPDGLSEGAALDRMAREIGIARVTAGAREKMLRAIGEVAAWTSRTTS